LIGLLIRRRATHELDPLRGSRPNSHGRPCCSRSYMTAAVDIVRRFMPKGADHRTALCAAIWLMGQCNVFVRNRELLAREPFSIMADEPFVEELTALITRLAMGGLLKANQN
jgi:hypothetical protein